jgi:hypothetical protein
MTKRQSRKAVDRVRYREYQQVAEHFFEAGKASMDLEYWTAAGLLIVHSAIAYADALSIKLSGQKSVGENHEDAVALIADVVPINRRTGQFLSHFAVDSTDPSAKIDLKT